MKRIHFRGWLQEHPWILYVIVPVGVLTPLLLLGMSGRSVHRQEQEKNSYQRTQDVAQLAAVILNSEIQQRASALRHVARDLQFQRELSNGRWQQALQSSTFERETSVHYLLLTPAGRLKASDPEITPSVDRDFSSSVWYKDFSRRWWPHVSGAIPDPASSYSVWLVIPVSDNQHHRLAIIAAGYPVSEVRGWLTPAFSLDNLEVAVVDRSGRLLASSRKELKAGSDLGQWVPAARLNLGLSGQTEWMHDDQELLSTYLSVPHLNWGVIAQMSEQDVHAVSDRFDRRAFPLLLLLVCGVIAAELAILGSLRRSERALTGLKALINSTPDAIFVVDPDYTISSWNPGAERIYGYSSNEIVGKPLFTLVPEERRHEIESNLARMQKGESIRNFETERLTKSGVPVALSLSVSAIPGKSGDTTAYSVVARDISERKRAEAQLRTANAMLETSVKVLQDRSRELTTLGELSDALQSCLSLKEAYDMAARYCSALFPGHGGALLVLGPAETLDVMAAWNDAAVQCKGLRMQSCWALRRGQPYPLGPGDHLPRCEHVMDVGRASICFPLHAQGEARGILFLEKSNREPFTDAEQQLATAFAQQVSIGVGNVALREELQNQSTHDSLTGLFNRRYLESALLRETRRALRSSEPIGVLLADIDHFKEINDAHGHDTGDLVLKGIAEILQNSIRQEDFACRMGGEEFCLVMPRVSVETALERAEAIRDYICRTPLNLAGKVLAPITISVGVAVSNKKINKPEQLLKAADEALYCSKQKGRNQVNLAYEARASFVPGSR